MKKLRNAILVVAALLASLILLACGDVPESNANGNGSGTDYASPSGAVYYLRSGSPDSGRSADNDIGTISAIVFDTSETFVIMSGSDTITGSYTVSGNAAELVPSEGAHISIESNDGWRTISIPAVPEATFERSAEISVSPSNTSVSYDSPAGATYKSRIIWGRNGDEGYSYTCIMDGTTITEIRSNGCILAITWNGRSYSATENGRTVSNYSQSYLEGIYRHHEVYLPCMVFGTDGSVRTIQFQDREVVWEGSYTVSGSTMTLRDNEVSFTASTTDGWRTFKLENVSFVRLAE